MDKISIYDCGNLNGNITLRYDILQQVNLILGVEEKEDF